MALREDPKRLQSGIDAKDFLKKGSFFNTSISEEVITTFAIKIAFGIGLRKNCGDNKKYYFSLKNGVQKFNRVRPCKENTIFFHVC